MNTAPLLSEFDDNPDMLPLVEMFAEEMPERILTIHTALKNGDTTQLKIMAHQLKGAGGGYGFDCITDAARTAEEAAKAGLPIQDLKTPFLALTELLHRAANTYARAA